MSLKYEPASEPLHISMKCLFSDDASQHFTDPGLLDFASTNIPESNNVDKYFGAIYTCLCAIICRLLFMLWISGLKVSPQLFETSKGSQPVTPQSLETGLAHTQHTPLKRVHQPPEHSAKTVQGFWNSAGLEQISQLRRHSGNGLSHFQYESSANLIGCSLLAEER